MLRILLVDDNRDDRALVIRQLRQAFTEVQITEVGTANGFTQALTDFSFDAVITDYQLGWSNGLIVLETTKAHQPDCAVIMFTNTATQETAIEAMKSGLDDYVIKSPNHYIRLPSAVKTALERIAAQRQAAGLQARIQTLLNQLDVGIYRLTSDGVLLEGNAAFLRLLGLDTLTEIPPSHTLASYFQPQDYAELLAQLKQNGEVRHREIQLHCADGTTRWVKISKTFTRANGTTLIDGLIEDITERKQAEAQAELEEQRSQFLAEASRLLSASLDYHSTLENLVNLAVPELADICLVDVIAPITLASDQPIVAASEPEQVTLLLELRRRYPHRDAKYGSGKVLHTGQSELRSDVTDSVLEDIARDADHLRLLQQLGVKAWIVVPMMVADRKFGTISLVLTKTIRSYDRLDLEMAEELARRTAIALDNARLYQEAQQANQTKDEFLAVVSHELRNPLNSMLGWAQLLRKREFADSTVNRAIDIIARNAKLQSKLIEDLLDVSRIIQNRLEISRQPVDLIPIIDAAIETVELNAEAKDIHIATHLDPSVGEVLGDAHRLEQAVGNLLSNAVKFTPNGGQVAVRLEQVDSLAQITVTDTGQGIGADFLPFLFERFRQADASKTRAQSGLGLGLAIVRQIVDLHDGSVTAESQGEGMGATFTIQLPLLPLQPTVNSDPEFPPSSLNLNSIHVLVVDDETDSRDFIAFVVEQAGARVRTAASAAEAIALLMESQFNLLLSDIGMPEMDGYRLMQQVRALPSQQNGQIPAIALTAFAGDFNQQKALQAGFQQHIAKPVEPENLIKAIARLCE